MQPLQAIKGTHYVYIFVCMYWLNDGCIIRPVSVFLVDNDANVIAVHVNKGTYSNWNTVEINH